MRCPPCSCWGRSAGFSLIEVAISMAVVGFAMISVLGLVPMGMSNFRQAMNNTVESTIVQSLTSELQLTSFANLESLTASPTQYDADGNPTTSSVAALYTVTLTLTPISSPVNLSSPTTADTVKISIVNRTQPTRPHTYSIILANQND